MEWFSAENLGLEICLCTFLSCSKWVQAVNLILEFRPQPISKYIFFKVSPTIITQGSKP